jgi:hypothetical protein
MTKPELTSQGAIRVKNVVIFNGETVPKWEFAPTSSHNGANQNECLQRG